jgi:hypothetical protein
MPDIDREFVVFAKRLMRHKKSIEQKTDDLVKEVFLTIAKRVTTHSPVWSGQSVLNWTAAISKSKPRARFVNVSRSNSRVARRTVTKRLTNGVKRRRNLRKVSGGREGNRSNINFDKHVALTSRKVAMGGIKAVVSTYENPSKPSSALPRATDVIRSTRAMKTPALFLSNNLSYTAKLWSGGWKSNTHTLKSEVSAAKRVLTRARILAR